MELDFGAKKIDYDVQVRSSHIKFINFDIQCDEAFILVIEAAIISSKVVYNFHDNFFYKLF